MAYGGFPYTKGTHEAKLGPINFSVRDRETVNVPVWAGVVAIVIGSGLLLFSTKKLLSLRQKRRWRAPTKTKRFRGRAEGLLDRIEGIVLRESWRPGRFAAPLHADERGSHQTYPDSPKATSSGGRCSG